MREILWQPGPEQIEKAAVTAFRRSVNERLGLALEDHDALYRWSVKDRAAFWEAVWRFTEVRAPRSWEQVLDDGDRMPGARWFTGARLNFAENLLRYRDDREALVYWCEDGSRYRLTYAGLYGAVGRMQRALRRLGVGTGDRVAGFLPNVPEAVVAMLATASLGAVWTSCSPDFGVRGAVDRFGQIGPKVLFATDGYAYGGRVHSILPRVREILDELPTVSRLVLVTNASACPDLKDLSRASLLPELLAAEHGTDVAFEALPFDHPLYILYSSGTTGLPKCMVHSAGGTLLQHLKEHVLHGDLTREDRIFYYTTCGWMMWNWLVSALATGATVMLYDGSPFAPAQALWDFAERERITVFGTSAKYISWMEKEGLVPRRSHDLQALRAVLSTGSPLLPDSFEYVYRDIKRDVQLSSISGGTDIISCFALGSPVLPVRRGELQCRGLGMKVEVVNDEGRPLVGSKGELVCTAPFPSMPTAFLNDPDGSKYRAAYFERFPGVWAHGDYAELTPEGGMVIHGRSDAVLKPGGVRIGTAEIYRIVERFEEVAESLAVGQDWKGDLRIVLFVRLREGLTLTDDLRDRVRNAVREQASPRHVPAKIVQITAIPRTISSKIVELAVREVIHGRPVKNIDALANPEALELYRNLAELQED